MKFIVLFDLYYDTNEELNFMYENFIERESDNDFLHSAINSGVEDKS